MSKADLLKTYVPEFIRQSKYFQAVYDVQGAELDRLNAGASDIVSQCFVDTASWGLKFWEQFLGIKVDETKDIRYRRSVIKSKIRGTGNITVKLIENVAESYENGDVQITEHPEIYSFDVKFIGTRGIPPNIDDLKAAIEEIKPAHLGVTYTFTFLIWDDFDRYNKTWDQWDALGLSWDKFEIYEE